MFRLCEVAGRTAEAGIRKRHRGYDDARVKAAFARLLHGDELVRRVWPGEELVEP